MVCQPRLAAARLARLNRFFAVGRWSATSASLSSLELGRQIAKRRISFRKRLTTTIPSIRKGFQERPFGVSPVGHYPQPFSRGGHDLPCPEDQRHTLLEFGAKLPAELLGEADNVLPPDVKECIQRQADRTPERMPYDPGQRDPDVPVKEFGVGWSRRGVVVNARTLDLGTIPLGGRVVQRHEHARPTGKTPQKEHQQPGAKRDALASDDRYEIIIVAEVDADGQRLAANWPPCDGLWRRACPRAIRATANGIARAVRPPTTSSIPTIPSDIASGSISALPSVPVCCPITSMMGEPLLSNQGFTPASIDSIVPQLS